LKIVSLSVEAKEYFLTCSTRNIVTLAHQNPQKSK
jgi:hypothetical protein